MKKIIVIGNGLATWTIANVLAEGNDFIKIIGEKNNSYGAQQLSKNGLRALENLLNTKIKKKILNKLTELKINSFRYGRFETLKNFYFYDYDLKYHSISRENLILILKNNLNNKKNIQYINQSCIRINKNHNKKYNIYLANNEVHDADIIIGTDGISGITRKYVCGKNYIQRKKVYRGISNDFKHYFLSKGVVQINLLKYGHLVSYPYCEGSKQLLNNVFIPSEKYQNDNNILNKIYNLHDNFNIEWKESFYTFDSDNAQNINKNNIYLFGEAAFTFEPHLAQGGNNILEDGFYLKNILNRNNISYDTAFKRLLKDRSKKKGELKKISSMLGLIYGFNNGLAILRNQIIFKLPDKIIYNFFKKIWKNEFYY